MIAVSYETDRWEMFSIAYFILDTSHFINLPQNTNICNERWARDVHNKRHSNGSGGCGWKPGPGFMTTFKLIIINLQPSQCWTDFPLKWLRTDKSLGPAHWTLLSPYLLYFSIPPWLSHQLNITVGPRCGVWCVECVSWTVATHQHSLACTNTMSSR